MTFQFLAQIHEVKRMKLHGNIRLTAELSEHDSKLYGQLSQEEANETLFQFALVPVDPEKAQTKQLVSNELSAKFAETVKELARVSQQSIQAIRNVYLSGQSFRALEERQQREIIEKMKLKIEIIENPQY